MSDFVHDIRRLHELLLEGADRVACAGIHPDRVRFDHDWFGTPAILVDDDPVLRVVRVHATGELEPDWGVHWEERAEISGAVLAAALELSCAGRPAKYEDLSVMVSQQLGCDVQVTPHHYEVSAARGWVDVQDSTGRHHFGLKLGDRVNLALFADWQAVKANQKGRVP